MSTSTVSATANPTTHARRRPVVISEKTTTRDLSGSGGNAAASPVGIDKVTGAEVVKKPITPNSATTQRKKRKKPLWLTVLSVLTKNLVLLLILVLLFQMIRWLALGHNAGSPLGFEERVAEMEAFLKKTTKMMQVQVDVVDKKIEKEIKGLRSELTERIDEYGGKFGAQLRDFDGRVESIERLLTSGDWVGRDEFDKLLEEIKKGNVGDVNLDQVRAVAKEIIEKEIEKHAADGLGMVDYAVASGGAKVVKHSKHYDPVGSIRFGEDKVHKDAVKILQPSFGEPGQCFPLAGNSGFVMIRLRTAIIPEAITLEHVAKSVAFDRKTAPKDCRVNGWLRSQEHRHLQVDEEKMLLLREFSYDLEKSYAQTFSVLERASPVAVDTIRLDFTSNHGNPNLTCIYRLRVHGHEPDSLSSL